MSKAKVIYRFQATLIDVLVCSIFIFLTMLIGGNLDLIEAVINETSISIDSYEYFNFARSFIIIESFIIVYCALIPMYLNGQTFGMYLFKIRFVQENGKPVGFGPLFLRQVIVNLMLPLFTLGFSCLLNIIIMIYRKDNATLADAISRIRVVDKLDY